jgi:hypothetical protein
MMECFPLITPLDEYKKNENQEKVNVVYTQTFIGNNIKDGE